MITFVLIFGASALTLASVPCLRVVVVLSKFSWPSSYFEAATPCTRSPWPHIEVETHAHARTRTHTSTLHLTHIIHLSSGAHRACCACVALLDSTPHKSLATLSLGRLVLTFKNKNDPPVINFYPSNEAGISGATRQIVQL